MDIISIGESIEIAEHIHLALSLLLAALLTWRALRGDRQEVPAGRKRDGDGE